MKKSIFLAMSVFLLCLCIPSIGAAETVYLDGKSTEAGVYTTLDSAVAAVENGGTVVVVGDTATPTSGAMYLDEKDVTITAQNGAVLTVGRALFLGGTTKFENITIANGASSNRDFIYCRGHKLVIGKNVTTVASTATKRYLSIFAGTNTGTATGGDVTVQSGTWRNLYAGNYEGTFNGTVSVLIDGATISGGSVYIGNLSGTSAATCDLTVKSGSITAIKGTAAAYTVTLQGGSVTSLAVDATVDLAVGGSVTVGAYTGTLTTKAPEGYAVTVNGTTYTVRKAVDKTPKTVYLDGTGATAGAYTSLAEALADMPGGGTVILAGNTEITAATTLPATEPVVITGVYGDENYMETASLGIAANVTLGGDTTFQNVVLERTLKTAGNLYIAAAGHKLVFDETAVCLNFTGQSLLSVVGGQLSAAHSGGSHIVIKAGHFRNVFGGNYNGAFVGDSHVEITGGVFDNAVCGGSYSGNFTGDAHLTFGGNAALLYATSAPQGVIGGTLGVSGGNARTFTGNIYLTLEGSAAIAGNVFGAARGDNITTVGDVHITVKDHAYAYYSLYAGGYASRLEGNTRVVIEGGELQGDIMGGSYSGTVTGNAEVAILGGRQCYYETNAQSSWPKVAGTKNVYGAGGAGSTLSGNATVLVDGGDIHGDVNGGGADATATVGGKSTVTVKDGVIFGKVANADASAIDLSAGGTVSIGVASSVDSLIGGGSLILAARAPLTVGALSGKTALAVNGVPLPQAYLTVETMADGAAVTYMPQDGETLVQSGNTYTVGFEGACLSTAVTVRYRAGCSVRVRAGDSSSGSWLTPDSETETASTYTLTPGLYSATVFYTNGNYQRKPFYIDGHSATETVTVEFDAAKGIGYESVTAARHTDEVKAAFYDNSNIRDFHTPFSPYFLNHPNEDSPVFTTNEEAMEFIRARDAECDYMYAFYPEKTVLRGFTVPVVVFTKDEIPVGASFAEIAEIVGRKEGRDIILITCAVHGNEVSAGEGGLAYIGELCGEYGNAVFDGTNVGAIVIFPLVNPEGLYDYTRVTPAPVINDNLNRDYISLSDVATQTIAFAHRLFRPTLSIDAHEAHLAPVWSEGDVMTDINDVGLSYYTPISSPLAKTKETLYGDQGAISDNIGEQTALTAIRRLDANGMRAYYYPKDHGPIFGQNYSALLGTNAYVIEIPGCWSAEENYARRVFTQMSAMKTLVQLAIESDGAMAESVAAAREKTALSMQKYDPRRAIVLHHVRSRVYDHGLFWNRVLAGPDGTVRMAENLQWQNPYNIANRYRTIPTAYVLSAETEGLPDVLALLDRQAIPYYLLPAGTTLALSRYSGTVTNAILGDETAVTFANGAYVVPVDGYRAYVTAYLFEPDNTDTTQGVCSFVQHGFIAVEDIYRSTESYIAAKMGVEGTYIEVETDGKAVANAVVDGVTYDSVATEGENAYVVSANESVTLNFTDGTSKTYYYSDIPGDIDGDRVITVMDALLLIRELVNHKNVENGDIDGDGKVSLIDVIRVMKLIAQ